MYVGFVRCLYVDDLPTVFWPKILLLCISNTDICHFFSFSPSAIQLSLQEAESSKVEHTDLYYA